jgi:hypothetical protein
MARRIEALAIDAFDILRTTDRTLGEVIEGIIGESPELEVIGQWREEPPHPAWVSPPLSRRSTVLERCTGYRFGGQSLSNNLAYVDLGRVDPAVAEELEAGTLHLGRHFMRDDIEKFGFEFGVDADDAGLVAHLRNRVGGAADDLHPFVWRRYYAAVDGLVTFIVIETLPCGPWWRLLGHENGQQRVPSRLV